MFFVPGPISDVRPLSAIIPSVVRDATTPDSLRLSDDRVRELASHGTPLYVLDESLIRHKITLYREALAASWGQTRLGYASKANSTSAVLKIAASEGCWIDVASEGEFRAALLAGIDPAQCYAHGNNKSRTELEFALAQGIGMIVADSFEEISLLASLGAKTPLLLRLAPGVDPKTHGKISTGQDDTKFGFNVSDGSGQRAVEACRGAGLNLIGVHCHVGSQLLDPTAQITGGEVIAQFGQEVFPALGLELKIVNVGGGLGVRNSDESPLAIQEYCQRVADAIRAVVSDDVILMHEPGRSLVAEAGVTLYQVGNVKDVPSRSHGTRRYVAVNGGLADNPRPALYGAKYELSLTPQEPRDLQASQRTTVSGRHCETDKLFEDVPLPGCVRAGDCVQVFGTGAYNSSMASNYNRYPRPATLLIRLDGSVSEIQRAETWEQVLGREVLPEDLV